MPDEPAAVDERVALVEKLWSEPDSRAKLENLFAEKLGPKAVAAMPAYQARVEVANIRKEVKDELAKHREETQRVETQRALADERRRIKDDAELRIQDDELPHVEKIMTEELVGTHRSAAELYRARQARDAVGAPSSVYSVMQIPGVKGAGGDDFKGLVEDPDNWGRQMAERIHKDFANGHGDRWA